MSKKKKAKEEMEQEMADATNNQQPEQDSKDSIIDSSNGGESAENSPSGSKEKPVTAEEQCGVLNARIEELNAKYLYLFAEFDNYRKRTQKERIDLIKSASTEMIVEMLPVLDDFERAARSFETATDTEAMKEGVQLIYNKFRNILVQKGLEEIKALGEPFNTDLHEAIANVQADVEENKGKVVDQVEKGYFLNGKVLRFAKVLVAN